MYRRRKIKHEEREKRRKKKREKVREEGREERYWERERVRGAQKLFSPLGALVSFEIGPWSKEREGGERRERAKDRGWRPSSPPLLIYKGQAFISNETGVLVRLH